MNEVERRRPWYKSLLMLAGLAIALVLLNFAFQRVRQQVGDQRAAIQVVLDEQVAAWNRGDLEGFMATYWESSRLTFFSGKKQTAGWQATLDRYRANYQAEGSEMGQLAFSEMQIEQIDATHAWVRARWQLTTKKDSPGGLFTLILERFPEGWRIVHDHTSS